LQRLRGDVREDTGDRVPHGRVALVTGGSRGIGRSIVETFAADGYSVAFTYLANRGMAEALSSRLSDGPTRVAAYEADVANYARAEEVVADVQASLGPIAVLVNNAGIRRDGAFAYMSAGDWQAVLDTNLTGTFNYSRIVVRELLSTGGAIVNITSTSGITGLPGQVNYSASKAGVIGFTKALARELARLGVRVNAIAPGFIESDMTASMDDATRKRLHAAIPMGKPGQPPAVADLALFLASDAASYITGQVYSVDGGLT
jgi:3-oxoacyl-[acyl-carrier protein] reductase